jgi:hypothetical protein
MARTSFAQRWEEYLIDCSVVNHQRSRLLTVSSEYFSCSIIDINNDITDEKRGKIKSSCISMDESEPASVLDTVGDQAHIRNHATEPKNIYISILQRSEITSVRYIIDNFCEAMAA